MAKGGALEKQYKALDANKKLQAQYEKAAKGQKVADQIADRDKLAALQKQIDLNNKLADARIKALTAAKEEGDIAREIAKAQAAYTAAEATGNTAAMQQASLDMEGLVSQQQFNSQVKNEENARDIKNAPLLKQIEAMQNKNKKISDNAALAGEKLGDLSKKITSQETAIEEVNSAMLNWEIELLKQPEAERTKWKASKESEKMLAAVADAAEKAGVKLNGLKDLDLGKALVEGLDSKLGAVSSIDVKGNVSIYVDGKKFDIGGTGSGTKSDPYDLGKAGVGTQTISGANLSNYHKALDFGPFGPSQQLKKLAAEKGVQAGQFFSVTDKDGKVSTYKVGDDGNITRIVNPYATGGMVPRYSEGSGGKVRGAGTSTSDSIPAMLSNGEYVLNAAATQNFGIPLLDQMNGSYNIPSNTRSAGANIINSPSSNNVYDINIVLNGTNVTAEDVIVQMKREMALVNAKEGISRRVGA
jgi:hypothetical protein